LVENACYMNRGRKGGSHAKCARACAQKGHRVALLTATGDVYMVTSALAQDNNAKLIPLMHRTVVLTGLVREENRVPDSDVDDRDARGDGRRGGTKDGGVVERHVRRGDFREGDVRQGVVRVIEATGIQLATVIVESSLQATGGLIRDLEALVASHPGTPLADKITDALAKTKTAAGEFGKTPPDNQAAVGNLEGAVGDLEAVVGTGLLGAAEGVQLLSRSAEIARQVAVAVLETRDRRSAPGVITEAEQALEEGDGLFAARRFKDAVNKWKDALAKAESVQPIEQLERATAPSIP
jgi:hypothetical protein